MRSFVFNDLTKDTKMVSNSLFPFAAVQVGVCFVATLTLLSIWQRGFKNNQDEHAKDIGIGFLVLGCATWAYVGVLQLVYGVEDLGGVFRPFLSVINSLVFCGAVAYFDVVVKSKDPLGRFLVRLFHPVFKVWLAIAIGGGLYILLLRVSPWSTYLDVGLSLFAIFLLLYALCYSFWHRGFRSLAIVAGIILISQMCSQIPELPKTALALYKDSNWLRFLIDARWVLLIVTKTMLCMLFIALAFSWMHEKAMYAQALAFQTKTEQNKSGTAIEEPKAVCLRILPPRYSEAKQSTLYEIEIRPPDPTLRVSLKEKSYFRIIELARRRCTNLDDGWAAYSDLHLPGDDNTLVRADYKEIAISVRDIAAAMLLQIDEERNKRRIAAEPQNIEMDMNKLRISTENSELELRRHIFSSL